MKFIDIGPSKSFEELLTYNDHFMKHGLSVVIEELMDESDYHQYMMLVQYLYLKRAGVRSGEC
jgi:hypothetical protein